MKIPSQIVIILLAFIFGARSWSATTIEFWTTETQSDRVKTIRLLMDTFEALNPDMNVRLVPVDENDVPSQLAAASAAGNLPHLIEVSSELIIAFGEEGILDTEGTTKTINRIGRSRFYDGPLKMLETGTGKGYYGLPFHGWIQGIWYRSDWFEDAGLGPPDTWENILNAAKTFYKPGKNQYGILTGTKADFYTEQCFTHLALSNGAREFNKYGDLVFNSKETLEAARFYADLAKFNPPGPQTWRARDYYLQGKMAMFFYSTYIMDDLALAEVAAGSLTGRNFPDLEGGTFDPRLVDNTGVVSTITGTQQSGYGAIVALGLMDQGSEKEKTASQKLVDFLYEPSSYITFLHMSPGGMNPVLRDVADMPEYMNDPKTVFTRFGRNKVKKIISGMDSIGSFAVVEGRVFPDSGKIYSKKIIPRMIYDITIEGKNPGEAVRWAEKEMKRVIED